MGADISKPQQLESILTRYGELFSLSEVAEVRGYLDASECGIALETLCGIIVETARSVPGEFYADLIRTASDMDVDQAKVNAVRSFIAQQYDRS